MKRWAVEVFAFDQWDSWPNSRFCDFDNARQLMTELIVDCGRDNVRIIDLHNPEEGSFE